MKFPSKKEFEKHLQRVSKEVKDADTFKVSGTMSIIQYEMLNFYVNFYILRREKWLRFIITLVFIAAIAAFLKFC